MVHFNDINLTGNEIKIMVSIYWLKNDHVSIIISVVFSLNQPGRDLGKNVELNNIFMISFNFTHKNYILDSF